MRAKVTYPKLEVNYECFKQEPKEEDLRQIYQQYDVQEIQVQGLFAFITFKNIEDAQKALDDTNGQMFKHAYLNIQTMTCFICGLQGHWAKNCAIRSPNLPRNFQYRQRHDRRVELRNSSSSSNSSSQSSQSSQNLRKKRNKNKEEQKNQSDSDSP